MSRRKKQAEDPADVRINTYFGQSVRRCRRARGWTQEALAERSGLSPDTIRRLEHGSFSPSLSTLLKLCAGLRLELSTLFEAVELRELDPARQVSDWVRGLDQQERAQLLRLVAALQAVLELGGDAEDAA